MALRFRPATAILPALAAVFILAGAPDAFAACDITSGAVSCAASTTTTDTTNTDAATASSSDRLQDYLISGAINGSIAGGVTVSGAGLAVENAGPGDLTFVNSGAVNQTIAASTGSSGALSLWAHSGNVNYSGSGSIATSTEAFALFLNTEAAGNITAHINGSVSNSLSSGYAVFLQPTTTGNIVIDGTGTLTAPTGIAVFSSGPGNVTIGGSGNILLSGGSGIDVNSNTAGTVTINRSGTITGTTPTGGIVVDNSGTGSTIISGTGAINIVSGAGILTGGTANVTITPGAAITADFAGISAQHTGASAVTINSAFDIASTTAILASSVNGAVHVNISGGTITATSGIHASSSGSGSVSVAMTGGAIGTAAAPAASGIAVTSATGAITVTTGTIFADQGLSATATNSGTISATINGAMTSTSATTGAVSTTAAGGATNIVNNAAITGATTTQGVVSATSTGGAIAITNAATGVIASTAASPQSQLAIQTSGGATTLSNTGTLTGLVHLGNAANSFANSGTWKTSGANSFGSGSSSFSNSGTLNTGKDAATSFTTTGSLSFANSGIFNVLGATAIGTSVINNNAGGTIAVSAGQTLTLNGGAGTLNNAGTVTGAGTIAGNIIVASGGTFAPGTATPGTSLNGTGTLVLQPGSTYAVTLNGTTSSFAKINGAATLAGNASAAILPGASVQKSYTILTAASLSGSFSGVSASNLTAGFTPTLSYDANNVYLHLTAALAPPVATGTAAPLNQQNVVATLNTYFNAGGALPPAFSTVYGLGGAGLSTALSQLSGEPGAALASAGSQGMAPFLDTITDHMTDAGAPDAIRPAQLDSASGLRTWASVFGGYQRLQPDATSGAHGSHADIGGLALGLDGDVVPELTLGASIAGGRFDFGTDQALGHGGGNMMAAGGYAYIRLDDDSYISAALAYALQDIVTRRLVTIGGASDLLGASFHARNYGGRVEEGMHFRLDDGLTITPFLGLSWNEFDIPAYAERALSGPADYALSYGAQNTPRPGTELGLRLASQSVSDTSTLTWDGHLAWQHNFLVKEMSQVSFLALPGSSFVINGTRLDADAGLLGIGVTLKMSNQLSFGAKVDATAGPRSQAVSASLTISRDW